ncbi:protein phosphatase 2C domain-containing protein [Cryptosporidium muris RN66]|uniref:Protein phosphatase 2C domain-containing protein n=1 Tax=Cryptosporidium muris (strain RN66) TaxID=441375 RepID=B6AH51_CRYMR|nr:protein phosphatase 2C domain-containing protein [Cryptosporidium muris RN66]EEA07542.1 protein phosphatase 2C domain-containing protein [Cryptosporidium muris RN66]|eukprot:XP_002141891.1 protein phosphatase 2C domain-containing protein [Cryptosporidium muris RN66]
MPQLYAPSGHLLSQNSTNLNSSVNTILNLKNSSNYILGPSKQTTSINSLASLQARGNQYTGVASFIHRRAARVSRSPSPERFLQNHSKESESQKISSTSINSTTYDVPFSGIIGSSCISSLSYLANKQQEKRSASLGKLVENKENYQTVQTGVLEQKLEKEILDLRKQVTDLKKALALRDEENSRLKMKLNFLQNRPGIESMPPIRAKDRHTSKSISRVVKDDEVSLYVCGNPSLINKISVSEFQGKPCLWKPNKNIAQILLREWKISWVCVEGRRTSKAMPNQDDFSILKLNNNTTILAVFDGHGRYGHIVASLVRQKICRGLKKLFEVSGTTDMHMNASYNIQMVSFDRLKGVYDLFDQVQTSLEKEGQFGSSGTSVTVAVIHNDRLLMIQLGSSGGLILNSDTGQILYKTKVHTLDNTQERSRIITKDVIVNEKGRFELLNHLHNSNNSSLSLKTSYSLTRSLGDTDGRSLGILNRPDIWETKVSHKGNVIVIIATDGFWEYSEKINTNFAKLTNQDELESITMKCQDCWMKMSGNTSVDDITIITIQI